MASKIAKTKSSPYAAFGQLLQSLRKKAGIGQQSELATLVNSRQQTVSRWEAGISRPRDMQMPVLATALNVDVEVLRHAAGYAAAKMPAATFDQPFPVDTLPSESFERFCFHLLCLLYPEGEVHRAGATGHTQDGLDIEVVLGGKRVHTFQCKRVEEFGPSKVRKAVAEHTRAASKKFIVLSRVASPQARDAIREFPGWDIWDKEDISQRIRSLSKHEQLKLVDTFFRGRRLPLLGEMEAGPWQTPHEFFAPFLTGHGIFSHEWQLVGRSAEVESLRQGITDEAVRAVFLIGAGGSGKSRIIKEAIDLFAAKNMLVTFLSPTEEVTNKSLEDLGDRPKVLVVDDAHDRADLRVLFQFAAVPANNATLLLAFRPYGLDYIRAQATSFALSGNLLCEVKLDQLTLDDATKLAHQVLELHDGPFHLAKNIAQLTRDCPLATVVGAFVVAKERRHVSLIANEDQFRSMLLGRFQDVIAGEVGGKADAEPLRRLLRVLALLQPFHPDEAIVSLAAEKIEQISSHEFHRLTRLLTDAGVLFRRGGKYRLSPDLLGDHIIEKVCVAQGGGSTGYAERVFDASGGTYLTHVLLNLGKLDWRRADGDPSNSHLLDGVWKKLHPQSEYSDPHMAAVSAVAYYQPHRALEFVEKLIRQRVHLREAPTIIRHVAFNLGYLQRACECLWQLGKDDARELGREPSHAIRILSELCRVEPNKPYDYNEIIVDFGVDLLKSDASMGGAYTPFDFLDGIVATEGDTTTSNGKTISWNRYRVAPKFVAPLRAKVIEASIGLLTHPNVSIAVLAARFLRKAISYGIDCSVEDRALWNVEFIDTLSKIEAVIFASDLDELVSVEIIRSVEWHVHRLKRDTHQAARRVFDAIPDTFEFRTAIALLNAYGAILGTYDYDFAVLSKEIGSRVNALVAEWHAKFPDAIALREALAAKIKHVEVNARQTSTVPTDFVWRLIQASLALAKAIVNDGIVNPASSTRQYVGMSIGKLLLEDRVSGALAIERIFQSGASDLLAQLSQAYRIASLKELSEDDLSSVKKLLGSDDERVVQSAVGLLQSLAHSDPKLSADLALHVNFGVSCHAADQALMVFYQEEGGAFDYLNAEHVERILQRLDKLSDLEGHWVDSFLSRASRSFPRVLAAFFTGRVERAANTKDWSLRPCSFGSHGEVPLRFREAPESSELLREISAWMNAHDSEDFLFHDRAKQLFAAMFSPFDDVLIGFLQDWFRVATEADLRTICSILGEAPNDFVFSHRSFVDEFLQRAKQVHEKAFERALTVLYMTATSGLRSGAVGEPFPQDLAMKENAERALKEMPRFSPSYELYDDIRKSAIDCIERSLREAERYEE